MDSKVLMDAIVGMSDSNLSNINKIPDAVISGTYSDNGGTSTADSDLSQPSDNNNKNVMINSGGKNTDNSTALSSSSSKVTDLSKSTDLSTLPSSQEVPYSYDAITTGDSSGINSILNNSNSIVGGNGIINNSINNNNSNSNNNNSGSNSLMGNNPMNLNSINNLNQVSYSTANLQSNIGLGAMPIQSGLMNVANNSMMNASNMNNSNVNNMYNNYNNQINSNNNLYSNSNINSSLNNIPNLSNMGSVSNISNYSMNSMPFYSLPNMNLMSNMGIGMTNYTNNMNAMGINNSMVGLSNISIPNLNMNNMNNLNMAGIGNMGGLNTPYGYLSNGADAKNSQNLSIGSLLMSSNLNFGNVGIPIASHVAHGNNQVIPNVVMQNANSYSNGNQLNSGNQSSTAGSQGVGAGTGGGPSGGVGSLVSNNSSNVSSSGIAGSVSSGSGSGGTHAGSNSSSGNSNNNSTSSNNSIGALSSDDKSKTTRGRKKGYVPNENKAGKNILTISQRLEILSEFTNKKDEKGVRALLSQKFGISRGRISQILNNEKDDIHTMVADPTKFTNVARMRLSSPKWSEIEHDLYQWIMTTKASNTSTNNSPEINLSFSNIKSKALELAKEKQVPEFTASSGWYSRFMKRVNLAPGTHARVPMLPMHSKSSIDNGMEGGPTFAQFSHADLANAVVEAPLTYANLIPSSQFVTGGPTDQASLLQHNLLHQMQPLYSNAMLSPLDQQQLQQNLQLQQMAQAQYLQNMEHARQLSLHGEVDDGDSDDDENDDLTNSDVLAKHYNNHYNDHKRKALDIVFPHDDTTNINMYLSSSIPDATSLANNFVNVLDDKGGSLAFSDDMRMGGSKPKKAKR